MIAALNLALASRWITDGQSQSIMIVSGLLAALFGSLYVIAWDRPLIVAADQRIDRGGLPWLTLLRALLIVSFAASSVFKMAPWFLHRELEATAASWRAEREEARITALTRRYDLAGLSRQQENLRRSIAAGQRAQQSVPPQIASKLDAASSCQAELDRERWRLEDAGMSRKDAARRISERRASCAQQRRDAERALSGEQSIAAAERRGAQQQLDEVQARRVAAEASIARELSAARKADAESITPASLGTLARLAAENDLAALQIFVLFIGLVLGEGAGLLMKAALGRTDYGVGVASARAVARSEAEERRRAAERRASDRERREEAFSDALLAALETPEVRHELVKQISGVALVASPVAAVATAAADLEAGARAVEEVIERRPEFSEVLGKALDAAIAMAARQFARAAV
jgi:hypothetical protein